MAHGSGPDYAEPAALPSSRRRQRRERRAEDQLWGGRPRRLLKVGAWVVAGLLALPLLLPALAPDRTGAATPRAAVTRLLHGIADLDPVAIASVVAPDEIGDRETASSSYDELSERVLRDADDLPPGITAAITAAEQQVGGDADLDALATLAAFDVDVTTLELEQRVLPAGVQVFVDGTLMVAVDPGRLQDPGDLEAADHVLRLGTGWRRDDAEFRPFLVAVERDGRWYVSLEATLATIFPADGTRR